MSHLVPRTEAYNSLVRRLAVSLLIVALILATAGCGGAAFYVSPANGDIFFATGTVTDVQLAISTGGVVTTVITLNNGGVVTIFTFCGNVVPQFPPNQLVNASYRQSSGCDVVVQVSF